MTIFCTHTPLLLLGSLESISFYFMRRDASWPLLPFMRAFSLQLLVHFPKFSGFAPFPFQKLYGDLLWIPVLFYPKWLSQVQSKLVSIFKTCFANCHYVEGCFNGCFSPGQILHSTWFCSQDSPLALLVGSYQFFPSLLSLFPRSQSSNFFFSLSLGKKLFNSVFPRIFSPFT